MTHEATPPALRLRSVFISDVHLGFKGCRAEFLLDFLRRVECERLYLVGDVIDLWTLQRSFHWPQAHNDVIRTILGKAKHGTRVTYIPGNHDRTFRDPNRVPNGPDWRTWRSSADAHNSLYSWLFRRGGGGQPLHAAWTVGS